MRWMAWLGVGWLMASCNMISGAQLLSISDEDRALADAPADASLASSDAGTSSPALQPSDAADVASADAAAVRTPKLVFVTSKRMAGNLGSATAADIICRDAARVAGLTPTEWRAWISTTAEAAIERIEHDGAYMLVDGTAVASDKGQLISGQLSSAIDVMETGQPAPAGADEKRVWTGTRSNGSGEMTCLNWSTTSAVEFGVLGFLDAADGSWTRAPGQVVASGGWRCSTLGRLYCFER